MKEKMESNRITDQMKPSFCLDLHAGNLLFRRTKDCCRSAVRRVERTRGHQLIDWLS
jgi:hypothetical protein